MIEVRLKDYVEYQGNTPLEDKTISKGAVLPLGDILSSLIKSAKKSEISQDNIMKDFAMYADFLDENNKQRLLHLVLLIELRKENRNIGKEHIKVNDFFKNKSFLENSMYKDYLFNFLNQLDKNVPKTTYQMLHTNLSVSDPSYESEKELSYWDKLQINLDNSKDFESWKKIGSLLENTSERLSTKVVNALAGSNEADEYFKNMNLQENPQDLKNFNLLINTYYEVLFPVEMVFIKITEDRPEDVIKARKKEWEKAIVESFQELKSLVASLKNENDLVSLDSSNVLSTAHEKYKSEERVLLVEIKKAMRQPVIDEKSWLELASLVGEYAKEEKDGVLGELFYQMYQHTPYKMVQEKLIEKSEFDNITRFIKIKRDDNEISIEFKNKEKLSFVLQAIKPEYIGQKNQFKINKLREYFLEKHVGGQNLRGDLLNENWQTLNKTLNNCINKMKRDEFHEKEVFNNQEILEKQMIRVKNQPFEIPMVFRVEKSIQEVIEKTVSYFMPMAFLYEDFNEEKVEHVFETFKEEFLMKLNLSKNDDLKSHKTRFKKF